jgi:hypothetical protein
MTLVTAAWNLELHLSDMDGRNDFTKLEVSLKVVPHFWFSIAP